MSLRIETGNLKGKIIETNKKGNTRYTPSQLRRTIINIFDFQNSKILEVFGGSGCVSFEMISNKAYESTIIETSSKNYRLITTNTNNLNLKNKIKIIKGDYRFIIPKLEEEKNVFDYIFADPPFNLNYCNEFLNILDKHHFLLSENGYLILEKSKHENINYSILNNFILDENRNYGDIDLLIFIKK